LKTLLLAVALSAPVLAPIGAPSAMARAQPEVGAKGAVVDLRPKLRKGQEVPFKMTVAIERNQSMPDADGSRKTTKTRTTQEIGLRFKVIETSPEAGSTLDLRYDSIKLDLTSPAGDISFDSTRPASGDAATPGADFLRPIVGLTLRIQMDKDGNITSVGGGDSLEGSPAASLASQFTGTDVVKGMFGPIFTMAKGRGEATVGDSWQNVDVMETPMGAMRLTTTNTLKSFNGKDATIDIKGSATLDPAGASSPAATVAIKESTIDGTAVWSVKDGMLKSMTTEQRLLTEQSLGGTTGASADTMKVTVTRR